jgi:hypothetical protein
MPTYRYQQFVGGATQLIIRKQIDDLPDGLTPCQGQFLSFQTLADQVDDIVFCPRKVGRRIVLGRLAGRSFRDP